MKRLLAGINNLLSRIIPEKQVYISTDKTTKHICISPLSQLCAGALFCSLFVWMIGASVALCVQVILSNSEQKQAQDIHHAYELRLTQLVNERDQRAYEAKKILDRFYIALNQISEQQAELLKFEHEGRELSEKINIMHSTLEKAINERHDAQKHAKSLLVELRSISEDQNLSLTTTQNIKSTLSFLTTAFHKISHDKFIYHSERNELQKKLKSYEFDVALLKERNENIFSRLETAAQTSLVPLRAMLNKKAINASALIADMRKIHSGMGGAGMGGAGIGAAGMGGALSLALSEDDKSLDYELPKRAAHLIELLDEVTLARIAVQKLPLSHPVLGTYRYTSSYGYRRDPINGKRRMHNGIDMAGPLNTRINATGDGVVIFAGSQSGYGRMVKIKHAQGFVTYYAHLNKINVKVGQNVSRGEKIGAMGNTGRSTGVNLHYEIRKNGKPLNPINYMKDIYNVF